MIYTLYISLFLSTNIVPLINLIVQGIRLFNISNQLALHIDSLRRTPQQNMVLTHRVV